MKKILALIVAIAFVGMFLGIFMVIDFLSVGVNWFLAPHLAHEAWRIEYLGYIGATLSFSGVVLLLTSGFIWNQGSR